MPKFIIERELPGAGKLSQQELKEVSKKSNSVIGGLERGIQWQETYVTPDKLYCVYISPNEDLIKEHAVKGGFPANRIAEIRTIIDPTTAD